jgi:hypothetical protein
MQNQITREVSFAELRNVRSVDELRTVVIDKEIETVLRASRTEQFKWLATHFHVNPDEFPVAEEFREISERRNLVAHNGGYATSRYVASFGTGTTRVGERLQVDGEYVEHVYQALLEMGVALAHCAWRQVLPEEREGADEALAKLGYELLVLEEYELAGRIFGFAVGLEPHSSEAQRCRFVVNYAQSFKWADDLATCAEIIDGQDWTAAGIEFRLAVAVLKEHWSLAEKLMEQIARADDLPMEAFRDWPLFRDFRHTPGFARVYHDVYGRSAADVDT